MTIKNLSAFVDALWDWGFLDECFAGTKIRVSDLDGMVERKGWVLIIEAKGMGKSVPPGQQIMFRALSQKGFTILTLWGQPNKPQMMQVWYPHKPSPQTQIATDEDGVKDIVRRWFNWANSNGGEEAVARRARAAA